MKDEGAEPYPSKRLGQHFLRDQRTIHRIIDALAPKTRRNNRRDWARHGRAHVCSRRTRGPCDRS